MRISGFRARPQNRSSRFSSAMTKRDLTIRDATERDAETVCAIYSPYIRNSTISFEETDVPVREMTERIKAVTSNFPWLVIMQSGSVTGYAYASKWHARTAYRHAVETTIYIQETATGRGLGAELYSALLARLRSMGFKTALGGIALPNAASVALHEKRGFKKVAHFRDVGFKFGRWIDVGY